MSLNNLDLLKRSLRGFTLLSLVSFSVPVAAYFYTIIGPDGHPIVVQQKQAVKKQQTPQATVQPTVPAAQTVERPAQPQPTAQPTAPQVQQPLRAPSALANPQVKKTPDSAQQPSRQVQAPVAQVIQAQPQQPPQVLVPPAPAQMQAPATPTRQVPPKPARQVPAQNTAAPATQQQAESQANTAVGSAVVAPRQSIEQAEIQVQPVASKPVLPPSVEKVPQHSQPAIAATAPIAVPRRTPLSVLQPQNSSEMSQVATAQTDFAAEKEQRYVIRSATPSTRSNRTAVDPAAEQNFTEIDGERYVDAEYLEQREFNLEGKKRFYVMPEVGGSGTHRMQTVEREKGITASILGAWRNKDPLADLPKALAPEYQRMSKKDVVDALEQTCFEGKKIDKAKTLSSKNRDIGFWPTAPINEQFSYEVARIDASISEILLTSYASRQKIPTYYWPLVVFLDRQGCVIEGVSGFKNQQSGESKFQYASLEGVLKKPQDAVYLFVTPLASAIDIDTSQLSNQGQFKLSVIR